MPRQGRLLEILVKHIQEFLAPQGIEIKSPEEFFRDGEKIGEIDITLRGDFGSSKIFAGIECRDRQSKPPQGRDWIREIKGKKDDLGVDKMIAVSSTGFTPQAIELANDFNIDLLHVKSVDQLELHDWFETLSFSWTEEMYQIVGDIDIQTEPAEATGNIPVRVNTPFFKFVGSDQLVSLAELMKMKLDSAFATLPAGDGLVKSNAIFEIRESIEAEYDGMTLRITRIAIPVQLSRQVINIKALLNVCTRLSDNDVVALTGYCRIETTWRKFNVLAVAKRSKSDPSKRDLRITFLNDDNEPLELPAGTHISLYGSEYPLVRD